MVCGRVCSGRDLARGLIFAARHPRLRIAARICIGRTEADLAEPAELGAAALVAAVGEPIERIVASPLRPALEVARAVARLTAAPLHPDDRLAERDFGAWEGRPWSTLPAAELDAWRSDPLRYRPGGGESLLDVLARLRRAWPGLASSAETTLILTHLGPIACLMHVANRVNLETAAQTGVPFGSVIPLH